MITQEKSRSYYDAKIKASTGIFLGYLSPEEFRPIMDECLLWLKSKQSDKQLNDVKRMKPLKKEIQIWMNEVWFPKAKETGLKYMAFVIPDDIFGKMSLEGANKSAPNKFNIEIQYFNDIENAKQWLSTK